MGNRRTLMEAEKMGLSFAETCGVKSLEEWRYMEAEKIVPHQMALFYDMIVKFMKGGGLPFTPCIDGRVLEDDGDAVLEQNAHLDIAYMIGCCANDLGLGPDSLPGQKTPLYQAAIEFSKLNEKLGKKPAYVYYFTRGALGDTAGAFHSAELWYIFGTLYRSWRPKTPADYELSRRMVSYWCNFFKDGDPNGDGVFRWYPCTRKAPFVMELDV
jgi:para-nitrobenzyl esterase